MSDRDGMAGEMNAQACSEGVMTDGSLRECGLLENVGLMNLGSGGAGTTGSWGT